MSTLSGVLSGGTTVVSGSNSVGSTGVELTNGAILDNAGTLTVPLSSGVASIFSDNNSGDTLYNSAGAIIDLGTSGSDGGSIDVPQLQNLGTIVANQAGVNFNSINATSFTNTTGTLDVSSGVTALQIGSGTSSASGFEVASFAVLSFGGSLTLSGGTYQGSEEATTVIQNTGTLTFTSGATIDDLGTWQILGTVGLAQPGAPAVAFTELDLDGTLALGASDATIATLLLDGGTLSGTGVMTVLGPTAGGFGSTFSGTVGGSGGTLVLEAGAASNADAIEGPLTLESGETLESEGALVVSGDVTGGSIINGAGALFTLGATIAGGSGVANAGAIVGLGGIDEALDNTGTVVASGGVLLLQGSVSGAGSYGITAGSTLDFSGTIASANTPVAFEGAGATLDITPTLAADVLVSGFGHADFIDLAGTAATGVTLNGGDLVVTDNGTTVATVPISNPPAGAVFQVRPDGNGGTDILLAASEYDFFGTGASTILWSNANEGEAVVWQMNGATPVAYDTVASFPSGWQIAGAGDFFGTGMSAILWENSSLGEAVLWQMNGATPVAYDTVGAFPSGWLIAGVGDFYGIAEADILWRNPSSGGIAIWQMNGATPVSETLIGNAPAAWKVAGVADFNGDGYADILWENTSTNQVAIWEMQGSSVLAYNSIGTAPSGWQIAGVGDFAGNGSQEILWENTSTDQLALWQTNGANLTGASIIANGVPFASGWQIAAVGDYSGNGTDAILWQNTSTGQVALWQTNGTTVTSTTLVAGGVPSGWQIAHNPVLAG